MANKSLMIDVVPFALADLLPIIHSPLRAKERQVPMGAVEAVEVIMESVAVPHREESASPRNPSVETVSRSAKVVILDV